MVLTPRVKNSGPNTPLMYRVTVYLLYYEDEMKLTEFQALPMCGRIQTIRSPNPACIMLPNQPYSNSIFWVEVDKIKPNPFQPRREFDEGKLADLSESIRQYGVLQPLVVTRKEIEKPDGGITTEYELIAGERRLRASRLAGVSQVPVVIRNVGDDNRVKLELAIIENLQREDLNPVDRAKAFHRLAEEFGFKHVQIAQRVNKSREYVSNSMRILALPEEMLRALQEGKISEGHTRPLLMLSDRPDEQMTLFKEMITRKITVREAENIARRIAYDKVRKKDRMTHPDLVEIEESLTERLGARVHIEPKEVGGRITISFTSDEDLEHIIKMMSSAEVVQAAATLVKDGGEIAAPAQESTPIWPEEHTHPHEHDDAVPHEEHPVPEIADPVLPEPVLDEKLPEDVPPEPDLNEAREALSQADMPAPNVSEQTGKGESQDDLYNIRNFSV